MTYELINELTESRLISSKHMYSKYDLRDIADAAFLYFIALQILFDEPSTHEYAKRYAAKTILFNNFNNFTYAGNDLYSLLHILTGDHSDESRKKLKNSKENDRASKKMSPNFNRLRRYLLFMKYDRLNAALVRQLLLELQKDMGITNQNYKSIRTIVSQWDNMSDNYKRLAMTRLLQAFRVRYRRSELLPVLEKLAKTKSLELKNVKNAEKADRGQEEKPKGAPWWLKTAAGAAGAYAGYKMTRRKK